MSILLGVLIPLLALAFIFSIYVTGIKKPRAKVEKEPKPESHAPEQKAHEPVKSDPKSHKAGHGDDHAHGGGGGWGALKFAVGLLAIGAVLYYGYPILQKIGTPPKLASRGTVVYNSSSATVAEVVSTDWVDFTAPSVETRWNDVPWIEGKPGFTIEVCSPTTDPGCTDQRPVGTDYQAQCQTMSGEIQNVGASQCETVRKARIRAATLHTLAMVWRYTPNS